MSSSDDDDGLVVLTRLGDLTTAQLVCGRLEADGIAAYLPDEHMATQTWHLHWAIGGIRVQVRKADLERQSTSSPRHSRWRLMICVCAINMP